MNGFTNSLLSFLLSWIRAMVRNFWTMVSSEDGGALYQFLAANWKALLLFLLAGGFLTDRIIYFFRWRPDYVWASRRERRKARRRAQPGRHAEPRVAVQTPAGWDAAPAVPGRRSIQPDPQLQSPVQEAPFVEDSDLHWDEDLPLSDWESPPSEGDYGTPKPEPLTYFRDVQAGFAPALPPQQLYARPSAGPSVPQQPVHPGLNEEAFRQNFGLDETPEPQQPVMYAPAFRPFTAVQEQPPAKAQGRLSRLARRARDLVSMDEEDAPTIRDLQSTVDVSKAFHEPVYPQPLNRTDDDF